MSTERRTLGDVFGGFADLAVAEGITLAAFAAVAIGSLGPWATAGIASRSGVSEGDGWVTLGLAALGIFQLSRPYRSRARIVFIMLIAAAAAAIVIYDNEHLPSLTVLGIEIVHIGWGAHLVGYGGIVALAAVWWVPRDRPVAVNE